MSRWDKPATPFRAVMVREWGAGGTRTDWQCNDCWMLTGPSTFKRAARRRFGIGRLPRSYIASSERGAKQHQRRYHTDGSVLTEAADWVREQERALDERDAQRQARKRQPRAARLVK